jgi:hypothetical protein
MAADEQTSLDPTEPQEAEATPRKKGKHAQGADDDVDAGTLTHSQLAVAALARARRNVREDANPQDRLQYQLATAQVHALLAIAEGLNAGKS